MSNRTRRFGGLAWLAALQFFAAEAFAAAAYPGYSYRWGYISDLGAAHCSDICSPRHIWMNASFVLQGALILTGLLLRERRAGVVSAISSLSLGVSALGVALVGLAPEDVAPGWHYTGAAANLVGCNLGALLGGLSSEATGAARSGVVAGALGLAACMALGFGVHGLGVGAVERVSAYPFVFWLAANGAAAIGGGGVRRARDPGA